MPGGLRLVRQMASRGKPAIIVNRGAGGADESATVGLDVRVGDALVRFTARAAQ